MAVTFETLNPEAPIFGELSDDAPSWWNRFKSDPSLYIEIRKDNQVNVYFEGGSIARIHYCSKHKKLQVFTHHKYLGMPAPSKSTLYVECSDFIDDVLEEVIARVKTAYSQKHIENGVTAKEQWSEKFIQGSLIINSRAVHLDSEFAYIDKELDMRIDMVRCDGGTISFVELKRMDDGRMLRETDEAPEIVEQMERYRQFIHKYSNDILWYYQKLYDVKRTLMLPVPDARPTSIDHEPQLIIFDRWVKSHPKRDVHRKRVQEILERENIHYTIMTDI